MTIEQSDIIDFVSFEPGAGDVILTISDHLAWGENEREHLLLLQKKLNTYLEFIESGQLYDRYPRAKGRNVVLQVACKFPLSEQANRFVELASAAIAQAGFRLEIAFPEGVEKAPD